MNEIEIKKKILSRCILVESGCLVWQGALGNNGYGYITIEQKIYAVHRLILKFKNNKWPDQTDHKCRNRVCVNEDHLEDVTYSENNKRMWLHKERKIRTHCLRNHELKGKNLGVGKKGRFCKLCKILDQTIRRNIKRSQNNAS